jgi:hypothetical protein
MKRIALAFGFTILALAPAASAEACGPWKTSVSSLMGEGTELNTHGCSSEKNREADFEIVCSGGGEVNFRFSPTGGIDGMVFDQLAVDYAVDGKTFTLPSQFEELDGAFAANIALRGPLLMAMKSGKMLVVSAKKNALPTYHVKLAGAGKALGSLMKRCK